MKRAIALAALVAAALISVLPAGAASPAVNPIVNPGFETGDLTGWTASASSGAVNVVAGAGPDGSFAAEITATATLSQTIPQLGGGLTGSLNKLKGWANFVDVEGGSCQFNDTATIVVDRIVAGFIASSTTVFSASSCGTGSTGWVQWSYNVPGQGAYRLREISDNGTDELFGSLLYTDLHTYQALSKVTP